MAEVAQGVGPGSAGAGLDPGAVVALLHWWKLAGADTPVGAIPTSWLEAVPVPGQQPARLPDPAEPAPTTRTMAMAAPVAARPDPIWDSLSTLDELAARMQAEHPRAPFADGNPASGLMILGEAPSDEDLRTGRPFSGPAGQFLDRMLATIGIDRTCAYISLLCPRKRSAGPPGPDDIAADLALTRAHIRLAAPRHILLLGANPVQALTGNGTAISRIRGQWLEVDAEAGPVPALATFNPAYLLRRPEEKARAWADLLTLKHRLSQ
jgi:DNA polymerase